MSELQIKDVGVFKTNGHSGTVGVVDVGNSKSTEYVIDLDDINAVTLLGRNNAKNDTLDAIARLGQDGKNFQNKQLGLIDNETGEVDPELVALIKEAAENFGDSTADVELLDAGNGMVKIAISGKGSSRDVLTIEGDQLNAVLADLSDIPAIADALPTMLDLKNNKSQIAVYDFDEGKNFFHGNDADVDSVDVKAILSGSSMQVDEAIELTQYALSAEGQADGDISIDFTGAGVIVSVEASRDTIDTFIFTGDTFFDGLATTTTASGKSLVDMKNSNSQIGVFDYDDFNNFFVGSDSNVDSSTARAIIGGSSLDSEEAEALVALALTGDDENVRYLGGDDDSAIVAVDASRDTVDTLFISGTDFDFV